MLRIVERRKFEDALLRARRGAEEARSMTEASRRELAEANRAESELLATMNHELRTPLDAISGYVQLLDVGIDGVLTLPSSASSDVGRR